MLRPFALHRPETLSEVADLLHQYGDEATLYAGGTELLLVMKEGLLRPRHVIDLKRIPDLGSIVDGDDTLDIGATVHHRAVELSARIRARCAMVAEVARHVANVRVRSVGTVGGNLAFADPHSDLATLFLTLDASVFLWSRRGMRELPLEQFVLEAYQTAREDDEVLTTVRLRPWPPGTVATYIKFGIYERPTLAVGLAMLPATATTPACLRLSVGCIGPRPERLYALEAQAHGQSPDHLAARAEELAAQAAHEVLPVDDRHGSVEYKRQLTRVFVRRALDIAGARASGVSVHPRWAHTALVVTGGSGKVTEKEHTDDRAATVLAGRIRSVPDPPAVDNSARKAARIAVTVNGQTMHVEVPAHTLLLDLLRDRLGLKGAKRSCDTQVCGACTVLVDGHPVSACTHLAHEVDGRHVRTIEGLADGETLHPLQLAFMEHGAVQCGFCTPGMLMTATALLAEDATPTRERIIHYLRGNLCRCTGYRKIIDAIAACGEGQDR